MQQFLEVTRIGLRTVINEDLVDIKVDATWQEVVLQDGLAQEVIALLRAIAVESLGGSHLVDSLMHSLSNGRTQRLGDVADAETDDVGTWVHHLESVDLLGDVGEQVVVLEVQEVDVY